MAALRFLVVTHQDLYRIIAGSFAAVHAFSSCSTWDPVLRLNGCRQAAATPQNVGS